MDYGLLGASIHEDVVGKDFVQFVALMKTQEKATFLNLGGRGYFSVYSRNKNGVYKI